MAKKKQDSTPVKKRIKTVVKKVVPTKTLKAASKKKTVTVKKTPKVPRKILKKEAAAEPKRAHIPPPPLVQRSDKPTIKKSSAPSSKPQRLMQNLSQTVLQFVTGKRYSPMTESELFDRLKIPEQLQSLCSQIIKEQIVANILEKDRDQICLKREKPATLSGLLRMHPKGFGFVIPDDPTQSSQDIFIPKHLTDNAVDGDQVEVVINTQSISEKGPEGEIVSILKRAHEHVAGIITQIKEDGTLSAYAPLLGSSKQVSIKPSTETSLKVGHRVILHVKEWGSQREPTVAEFSHLLGSIDDPSCDTKAAIEEFDIRSEFPQSVISQAKKYGKTIPAKELKKRMDLSKIECFTIDPDTAKDFDDALTLTKDKKGIYHLGVHIADVAHYVTAGSPLDKEAILRGNSTYLPGTCIPMLPEELSNELCSLQPLKNRLTVSVLMDFDKSGNLIHHEVVRAYIKSKKRFTYLEAKDVLDGTTKSPHKKTLQLMVKLCQLLKAKRYERGSIDFSLDELVVVIDKNGEPQGLKKVEYDITHQLVEEFMLKANEVVAIELNRRGKDLIYRVHEEPQEENKEDFLRYARTLGFKVPLKPTSQDLQQLFKEVKGTTYQHQLSVAFIRSMRLAQYSPDNVGHFGLALEHYCHFTSPIRRYSDLVIERLLFDEEPKELRLDQIARHCSDQERVSFRAEMSVKTLKKLRLLKRYFSEDPTRVYKALITKIKPFGLFFELQDLMLEGFLHISELENDYFIYDEKRVLLWGRQTGKIHKIAESIEVKLTHVDLIQIESKWQLANSREKKSKTRGRRSR